MNTIKRGFTLFALVLVLINILTPIAYAAPSTNYALTGNQADDLVAVAMAQKGKTGSDFSFTADWCVYFVCWAAKAAGINNEKAFPKQAYDNPRDLSVWYVKNKTGTYYYFRDSFYDRLHDSEFNITDFSNMQKASKSSFTPQKGDLILFSWNTGSSSHTWSHIGIVYKVDGNNIHYVDGNYSSQVCTHANKYSDQNGKPNKDYAIYKENQYIVGYLRPNYSASGTEVTAPETDSKPEFTAYNANMTVNVGAGSTLRFCTDVSADSNRLASIPNGATVYVCGFSTKQYEGKTWAKIQYNGMTGYVNSAWLAKPSVGSTCVKHSYNSSGYCNTCGSEYPIRVAVMTVTTFYTIKDDVPVRARPYASDMILKYLSKNEAVTAVANGKNSVGNLWYKLSDGNWIFSDNLTKTIPDLGNSPPKPAAVKTMAVSVKEQNVTVSWNEMAYATSYDVYLVENPWGRSSIMNSKSVSGSTASCTFTDVPEGDYAAFVISRPNADTEQSEWKYFSINNNQASTLPPAPTSINPRAKISSAAYWDKTLFENDDHFVVKATISFEQPVTEVGIRCTREDGVVIISKSYPYVSGLGEYEFPLIGLYMINKDGSQYGNLEVGQWVYFTGYVVSGGQKYETNTIGAMFDKQDSRFN